MYLCTTVHVVSDKPVCVTEKHLVPSWQHTSQTHFWARMYLNILEYTTPLHAYTCSLHHHIHTHIWPCSTTPNPDPPMNGHWSLFGLDTTSTRDTLHSGCIVLSNHCSPQYQYQYMQIEANTSTNRETNTTKPHECHSWYPSSKPLPIVSSNQYCPVGLALSALLAPVLLDPCSDLSLH